MSKLDEIAKVAGVSRHTVARILNGRRQEKWPAKQEQGNRIRRIAEEMGYRPADAVRTLVLGKYNTAGLLTGIRDGRNKITQPMLEFIDEAFSAQSIQLALIRLDDSALTDADCISGLLSERMCDGLLIVYQADIPHRMLKLIDDLKIPAVWLNHNLERNAVYGDDYGAAAKAAEYLLELGHRRIVYADHSFFSGKKNGEPHYSQTARRDGYVAVMKKAGIQPDFIYDDEDRSGRNFTANAEKVFGGSSRPTAMLASCDTAARAALLAAASMGISIPGSLSYISFKNACEHDPLLSNETAMLAPEEQMCRDAVNMLLRRIADPQAEFKSIKVSYKMFKGGTAVAYSP